MPVAGGASGEREASILASNQSCMHFLGRTALAIELCLKWDELMHVPDLCSVLHWQACKTEACAIQTCLSKNHYQGEKCQEPIQALMKCCEKYQVLASLQSLLNLSCNIST